MLNMIATLGLAGLVASMPTTLNTPRQVTPNYPPTSTSQGFLLIANVTKPCRDFNPPVNGWILNGIHVGAGENDAVLEPNGDFTGRVFYENGTAEEIRYGEGNVLSDGGTPPFPYGIGVAAANVTDADGLHDVSINVGSGSAHVQLAQFPAPYPTLTGPGSPGTYVACNQTVPYYRTNYITVRYAYDVLNPATSLYEHVVPAGCVAINLLPQCATLDDLPAGSLASHEFANTVNCYEDVSAINWKQYGP